MKEELKFKLNIQNFGDDAEPTPEPTPDNNSYLEIIKKQKEAIENSVSKDEYEKLKAENASLQDILINGGALPDNEEEPEKVDIEALRREIFNPENSLSNLEFTKKSLKLRNAILERDGVDIFATPLGVSNNSNIVSDDKNIAENVASGLQWCVDKAHGDDNVFTATLQSITIDGSPFTGRPKNIKRR